MVTVTDKVCIACGKELKNVPVATVFCPECRKKRRRELLDEKIAHERAKRASEKAEMDALKPKVKKKYEGPSLQEIMHEATKEGLQYVAYCKKHGLH